MRIILIISLVLLTLTATNCHYTTRNNAGNSGLQPAVTGTVEITFTEYEHNFGKVADGVKVGHKFTFENKGTGNLIIASVTTSCGCTVPKYDNEPIPPGGKGALEIEFDTSGRKGMQTKTINVKSNASTPVVLLKITAEVVTNNN
jgi:hypothetical protein